ncbi:MAG: hypothetical protein M0D53_15690 [Flavobacterium sp. JAD_PAG50586_2]|nr:MAG: hypothetical protein M0D53_15690 [Flavobacterium sp. JAD_PAG50586_2]
MNKNEFDLYTLKRKIKQIKNNYEAALKLFQLTDFTIGSKDYENEMHLAALKMLNAKAVVILNKNNPQQLMKLEIRLKLLEQEIVILNELLK